MRQRERSKFETTFVHSSRMTANQIIAEIKQTVFTLLFFPADFRNSPNGTISFFFYIVTNQVR